VTQQRNFWMRWRVRSGYVVAVVYWLLATPAPRAIFLGGIVALVGLMIRGASSGYLRKYESLATTGPYAITRNPLYFGSGFLALGFAVAGDSRLAGLLVLAYFAVFYYPVMRNEESDLRQRYGVLFDEYAARVPLFFPWISRAGSESPAGGITGERSFSWPQYLRNREYKALVGTLAGLAIVWLRMWIRAKWGY
jgi:protein-S-isoprenylcysteine O-methyltransferase Ste14